MPSHGLSSPSSGLKNREPLPTSHRVDAIAVDLLLPAFRDEQEMAPLGNVDAVRERQVGNELKHLSLGADVVHAAFGRIRSGVGEVDATAGVLNQIVRAPEPLSLEGFGDRFQLWLARLIEGDPHDSPRASLASD